MILNSIWYQSICIFIFGLIVGSFLNVLINRTIAGESIISPASKCPKCQSKLLWWHNIPILSYFILKGKCYFCHSPISIQYPIVEILNAGLYVLLWQKFNNVGMWILACAFVSLFLTLSVMDIKLKKISVKIASLLILVSLLFNYNNILSSILAGVAVLAFIFISKKIIDKVFQQEVLGEGDIYLLVAVACFVGIKMTPIVILLAFIIQALVCAPEIFKCIIDEKKYVVGFSFIWFAHMYALLILDKFAFINLKTHEKIVIFVNLLASLYIVCKFLFLRIKNLKIVTTAPFAPSIFISSLIYLFLT